MVKECTKCGEEKPLTEFHKQRGGKYGVAGRCKECKSEYLQRLEVKERERLRDRARSQSPEYREYRREIRKKRKEMGLVYEFKGIEITKKYATRSGKWSDAETEFLLSSDLPLNDIALELGRTYSSVAQRRFRLLQSR